MFLFESSKDKAIREDVQRNMEICISNSKRYNEAKQALVAHLNGSNQKIIEMIVDNIKATIKNQDLQPIRKYQAILLLKDITQTHNKALGKYVVKKMLKRLTILAQHKCGTRDEKDQQRGRDIFGPVKKDQQQYSIKFFNTLLMTLQEWGKNWSKAPDGPNKDFHRQYNDLLMNGVQFPKQRPKQMSKSPSAKNPREDNKSPIRQAKEEPLPKSKPKQQKPPQKKASKRLSNTDSQLRSQLSKFYVKMRQSINLLSEVLEMLNSQQELSIIQDVLGQLQKNIEIGNQLIISIQGSPQLKSDQSKIKHCFDFLGKIQKDIKILAKSPAQNQVFKNKYIKLSKQALDILSQKASTSNISKSISKQNQDSLSPSNSVIRNQPTPEKKIEQPKVKIQNRYSSTHGMHIQSFQNNNQYQTNGAQSVNSNKFGSFGGPGATDRQHRGSFPQQNTPPISQNSLKENPNLDKKYKIQAYKNGNQIKEIPQQNISSMKKVEEKPQQRKPQTKKIEQKLQKVEQSKSQSLFKQFQVQQKGKESIKQSKNPFKDNESFGFGPGFSKLQKNQKDASQDFFAEFQEKQAEANNDANVKTRKKKVNPNRQNSKEEPQDFFKEKINSNLGSSNLSGFQFSKIQKPADGSVSINIPTALKVPAGVNNEEGKGDPFEFQNSQHNNSKLSSKSNFFDQLDKDSKNVLPQILNNGSKAYESDSVKQKPEVKFQTGNFGNMIANEKKANPFETQSIRSKKQGLNSSNPFGENQQKSQKSLEKKLQSSKKKLQEYQSSQKENPFDSKIYANPFESNINTSQDNPNPFQTSSFKSKNNKDKPPYDIQQFFKPPKKPSIESLSQRGSFKNMQSDRQNKIIGGNLGIASAEPIRDSLIFSAKMDKSVSDQGLNFSQFLNIGENRPSKQKQNPFEQQNNEKAQFSGFSLSNFQGIGENPLPNIPNEQNQSENAIDFFAKFQKESINSKKSKKSIQKPNADFFDQFKNANNLSVTSKHGQKQMKIEMSKQNNIIERQKTVYSGEQRSFDFSNLEKTSAILSKKQKKQTEFDLPEWDKMVVKKESVRDGLLLDNQQQKSLSWGDFDKESVHKKPLDKNQQGQIKPNLLGVQSRMNLDSKPNTQSDRKNIAPSQKLVTSRSVKFTVEPSSSIKLQDFIPISKKGIEWNPMIKIANIKATVSPYYYNVDDRKLQLKKLELAQKQREYVEKMEIFKKAKGRNDEVRTIYLDKMKKVQQIIHMRKEYQQILKKIKQNNDIKEKQIQQIHHKIKRTEEIKAKILQKQKQLYQITKNQINIQEKKVPIQRNMALKWELFNKNLEHNRTNAMTMHSRHTQGF